MNLLELLNQNDSQTKQTTDLQGGQQGNQQTADSSKAKCSDVSASPSGCQSQDSVSQCNSGDIQNIDVNSLSLQQLENMAKELAQLIEQRLSNIDNLLQELGNSSDGGQNSAQAVDNGQGANAGSGIDNATSQITGDQPVNSGDGSSPGAGSTAGHGTSAGVGSSAAVGASSGEVIAPVNSITPVNNSTAAASGSLADALAQNDFANRGKIVSTAPFDWANGKGGENGPQDTIAGNYPVGPWGIIYPEKGKTIDPNATVDVRNGETYYHLRSGGWVQALGANQDQWWEGNFREDLAGNVSSGPGGKQNPDGSYEFAAPPAGMVDHFGPGTAPLNFDSNLYDGVYTTMQARTSSDNSNMVMMVGTDHYDYRYDNGSADGFGLNNWTRLSTDWQSMYYTSLDAQTFQNDPPPGLS